MNEIDAFYQKQLEDFLRPHFESLDALTDFLSDVFDYKNGSVVKRQMLYQTMRFVSLANNIEKISPASDGLKILFLRICQESLCSLSHYNKNKFIPTFARCFTAEGQDYILNHFKLSFFEDEYCGLTFEAHHDITLTEFLWLVRIIRDNIVHNGRYWSMQLFAYDEDSIWFTSMETNKKVIEYNFHRKGGEIVEYHFETTLNYERFIFYFVEACINYIRLVTT